MTLTVAAYDAFLLISTIYVFIDQRRHLYTFHGSAWITLLGEINMTWFGNDDNAQHTADELPNSLALLYLSINFKLDWNNHGTFISD